jgi:plasmid stabilization system protein ParE
MKLRFTPRATENLAYIADYLHAHNPSAASVSCRQRKPKTADGTSRTGSIIVLMSQLCESNWCAERKRRLTVTIRRRLDDLVAGMP